MRPILPSGLSRWRRPIIPRTTKSSLMRSVTSNCRCRVCRRRDRPRARGIRVKRRGLLGRCLAVVLGELLVDPVAAVVAAPDLAVNELPVDRAARHEHRPEVPDLGPARLRTDGSDVAIERHDAELTGYERCDEL